MNKNQLALLRSSAAAIAHMADAASASFYHRLFEDYPALRPLFRNEMGGQGKRLMQMIDTAVFALDRPAMLHPLLRQLGQRHVGYGVQPEHYPMISAAMLDTLAESLGDAFTADVREAWEAFLDLASRTMLDGAREAPAPLPWESPPAT